MRRILVIVFSLSSFWGQSQIIPSLSSKVSIVPPAIDVTSFGAVADFTQAQATTNGTNTITISGYSLTSADVGKVISIFDCHKKTSYSEKTISLTTIITSVVDATHCTVITAPTETASNKKCYIGTNNYNAIQHALDYAYNKGIATVNIPSGTFYVVPALATFCQNQIGTKGIQVRGNVTIAGAGSSSTKLKFGSEDIHEVNTSSVFAYKGFHFKGAGNRSITGLTMEGADRSTTETINSYTEAIYTDQTSNIEMVNTFTDFKITGEQGWGGGFNSSRGGHGYLTTFTNSRIEARSNCISYFSADGANKTINLTNVVLQGGGGNILPTLSGSISGTTITITKTDFSFYDLRSLDGTKDRKFYIHAGGFDAKISSITSPKVAVLESGTTYSGTITLTYDNSNNVAENHIVYMHPNVTYRWEDVELNDARKLSFRTFSSGGTSGTPSHQQFINVVETPSADVTGAGGCEFMTNMTNDIEWTDCDISLSQADVYNVTAINTNIQGGQLYGDVNFTNCTGAFDHRGTSKSVVVDGGVFTSFTARGTGSTYTVTDSETPQILFGENIGGFSWDADYIGYMSWLPGTDVDSWPSSSVSNITARGNVIGYDLFHMPGYSAEEVTTMQSKFNFTNCTFDAEYGEYFSNVNTSQSGNTITVTMKTNVTNQNQPPSIELVTITGTPEVGETLTANVSGFYSPGGYAEGTHTFQWYRSTSVGSDGTAIVGATSSTYDPISGDDAYRIRCVVTPVQVGGMNTAGTPVTSMYTDPVDDPAFSPLDISWFTAHFPEGYTTGTWVNRGDQGGANSIQNASDAVPTATADGPDFEASNNEELVLDQPGTQFSMPVEVWIRCKFESFNGSWSYPIDWNGAQRIEQRTSGAIYLSNASCAYTPTTGKWIIMRFVISGSSGTSKFKVNDGTLKTDVSAVTTAFGTSNGRIGSNATGTGNRFDGLISHVFIKSGELNSTQENQMDDWFAANAPYDP